MFISEFMYFWCSFTQKKCGGLSQNIICFHNLLKRQIQLMHFVFIRHSRHSEIGHKILVYSWSILCVLLNHNLFRALSLPISSINNFWVLYVFKSFFLVEDQKNQFLLIFRNSDVVVLNLYSTFIQVFYIVKRKPKSFPFSLNKTYFYDGFYIPLSIGQEVFSFSNLIKQVWKIQNHLITNVTQLLYRNLYRLSQMLNDAANFSFFLNFFAFVKIRHLQVSHSHY